MLTPFHLAITVHDLALAREFYGQTLGFSEGRSSETWIDFDMFGHQFVVHLDPNKDTQVHFNSVDDKAVPVPHFGVVLPMSEWRELANRLEQVSMEFIIEPYVRFAGEPGEQGTLFFTDPSGNALEFKGFEDISAQLFAT